MTDPHRNRSFTRTVFSSLPVLAFMVFACSDGGGNPDPDPDPPRADSIALQPSSISFDAIGDTVRIQATVLDQYGDPMQGLVVVWASDNIAVARVDQAGLVTSVGDGSTVVRAQASSKRNSLTVDVAQEPSRLEALEGDGQQQWTGFALRDPLRVRLTDGAGSPVVGEGVAWEVLEGEGTVTPAAPVTDPDGEVQAIWVLGEGESGAQKVSATVEGLDPVEFNATGSSPLTLLNVEPLTAPMLDTLVGRLLARDSLGLPESGIPIAFRDITGFGEIVQGPNTTDVNGELEIHWALGPTPGPQEVTVVRADIDSDLRLTAQATGTLDPWPFTTVSPGFFHTCAIQTGGSAYCWGRSRESQLALADTLPVETPTALPSVLSWADIGGGEFHSCALEQGGGSVYCWGTGFQTGVDGDGTQVAPDPVLVPGGPWSVLTAGSSHNCALKNDGTAWCWGVGEFSQLGGGAPDTTAAPVAVTGGHIWSQLSAGHFHTCGLTPGGDAYCWGRGDRGQLGNGGVDEEGEPVLVAGGRTWSRISAGRFHTCGIDSAGDAFCWGEGEFNQLGYGNTDDRFSPVKVLGGKKWNDIAAGQFHSCGVDQNNKLYCWGRGNGYIGLGAFGSPTPAVVLPAYNWRKVDTQGIHTCAISLNWETYCWGPNDFGQLGIGSTEDSGVPRILVRGVF